MSSGALKDETAVENDVCVLSCVCTCAGVVVSVGVAVGDTTAVPCATFGDGVSALANTALAGLGESLMGDAAVTLGEIETVAVRGESARRLAAAAVAY